MNPQASPLLLRLEGAAIRRRILTASSSKAAASKTASTASTANSRSRRTARATSTS